MMRLSRLADFAVVLMTHVAQHPERVHTASDAAVATQLPAPTVAKVMAQLCREGLLVSGADICYLASELLASSEPCLWSASCTVCGICR